MAKRTKQPPEPNDAADLAVGEAKIRECLKAEALTGWALAEAVTEQHALITDKLTVDAGHKEYAKQMKGICGYPTLKAYWVGKFELKHQTIYNLMVSLGLYNTLKTSVPDIETVQMSPFGIMSGLIGITDEGQRLAVLEAAIKNAPPDGRVGWKSIRKTAKAYLEANKPEEPPPSFMEELMDVTKPLHTNSHYWKRFDKFFQRVATSIDLEAVTETILALETIIENHRRYKDLLRVHSERVTEARAKAEAGASTETRPKAGKRKRKAANA
jgi:hypothetical protein